jgi:hypothetical protein
VRRLPRLARCEEHHRDPSPTPRAHTATARGVSAPGTNPAAGTVDQGPEADPGPAAPDAEPDPGPAAPTDGCPTAGGEPGAATNPAPGGAAGAHVRAARGWHATDSEPCHTTEPGAATCPAP